MWHAVFFESAKSRGPGSEFASPANQNPKGTIKKKKAHKPLRTSENFTQKISPSCLIIIQSCYFDYKMNTAFRLISLRDVCFALCSRDLEANYVRKGS